MPPPNSPNVAVTPPSGTSNGSCVPFTATPVGRNALVKFQFATANSGWKFAANAFQIKATSPNQPPPGMFTVISSNDTQVVVRDFNGDGKLYTYSLSLIDPNGNPATIDPEIQNDSQPSVP